MLGKYDKDVYFTQHTFIHESALRLQNIKREVIDISIDQGKSLVLDREFLEADVIYIKYADQQIRQLVDAYYQAYGKLISSAMNVYKRSNARRYVLKGNLFRPQDNTTQDQINKMMTSQFKAFMEADNAGAVFQLQNEYTLEDFSGNFQSNSRDIKT
ncbi:hypothetical protein EfmJHP38_27010 [Enterococcus faecium]|nr:hypothetical protein EfmJHP38_27010 [Enterococcus faecium]